MNRILRFLLLSCLFSGCGRLLAAQETAERFFIDMAETYGVPEGVGELNESQAKKQNHYRFQYDKAGRVVRVESRDPSGRIEPDFFHVRTLTFEYGEDGSLLRRVWRSPEDAVDLVWRYDGRDRIIFEDAFLGELPPLDFMPFRDGLFQDLSQCMPNLTACGNLAGLVLSRDEKGRVVRVDFLRADGAQGFDSLETGGHLYERDGQGRFTRAVLLNEKGQPHADSFGVSEYRFRYEGDYLAELGCYGIDGKPVNNNRGFAFLRQEFPGPELCRTSLFGAQGEPVTDKQDGYSSSILRTRFDGRNESISFFGPDGLPCAGLYGAARLDFFYPDKNTEEIRKTFPGGNTAAGYPRIRITRNKCGRVVRTEFFTDESGHPKEVWIDTLSERGLLLEREIRNGAGLVRRIREIRRDNDGALSVRTVTDDEGHVEREEHFEYDNLGNALKYYDTSFGGIRQELDENGRFVKEIILDKDGKDTKNVVSLTYDGSGRPKTRTVISEDADPPSPIRKTVFTRDARGNAVREDYFGEDGKPPKDGLAVTLREFDDRGNETLVRGLTSAGAPALLPDESYAERKQTFDQRDNVTAVIWLDCDLVPVFQPFPVQHPLLDSLAAAIARMQYDSADELIRAELFPEDETGFPAFPDTASIRIARSIRPHGGEEIHLEFFDLSGARACPYGGNASVLRVRRDGGKTQITFLNGDLEKTTVPKLGYAESIFDARTGEEPRYYDAEGNPVTPPPEEDEEDEADGEEEEAATPEKTESESPAASVPENKGGSSGEESAR